MAQIILFNFLVLFTFGSANLRHRIISEGPKSSFIDEVVVDILRRCFVSDTTQTIGFIGKSSPIATLNTTFSNSITTVLLKDPKAALMGADDRSETFYHGLPYFVMSASDEYSAEHLLMGLKKTRWWNHEASFIILDRSISSGKVSCVENARKILLKTWKMDILSSIFVCSNYTNDGIEANSAFLYTYNPYEETAPMPWTKVDTHTSPEGHSWTLFEQVYDSEKTTCDSTKFDNKTLNLNGFKISANVKPFPPHLTLHADAKNVDDFSGIHAPLLKIIWKKWNASMSLKIYDSKASFGDSFENGSAKGMIADLVYDKCDINLNLRYIRQQWGIRFSLAQAIGGLSIVTNHRGWKSPLMKIGDFIKFELIFIVLLVCSVAVLLSGYSPSRFILPDLMNVPRLFLSTGTAHLPTSMPQRLLLFAAMFMVLIINSAFQGKLAELLTSPISNQQIDTINDVDQFGYEIYGYKYLSEYIPLHLFDRFHDPGLYYTGFCSEVLANNSNAACIAQKADVSVLIAEENLYISSKFAHFHKAHTIRRNWPLYERFNRLIERLVDSGLARYWKYDDETPNFQTMIKKSSEKAFRALKYEDLRFVLKILAAGLAFSSVIFIIEIFLAFRRCGVIVREASS